MRKHKLGLCGMLLASMALAPCTAALGALVVTGNTSPVSTEIFWTGGSPNYGDGFTQVAIGDTEVGHLTLNDFNEISTLSTGKAIIGSQWSEPNWTTPSTASVSGNGVSWLVAGELVVSDWRYADMTISAGATVTAGYSTVGANSTTGLEDIVGILTVTGANTQFNTGDHIIGDQGKGSMTVSGGATVDATGVTGVTQLATSRRSTNLSTGLLDIKDSGSSYIANDFLVGIEGNATMTVSSSAYAGAHSMKIGMHSLGEGTVNISGAGTVLAGKESIGPDYHMSEIEIGSEWEVSLGVWDAGTGSMTISDGALFRSLDARIGKRSGSDGALTVDGGTMEISDPLFGGARDGDIFVGVGGSGSMTVEGGGVVNTRNTIVAQTGEGTVTVKGSGSQLNQISVGNTAELIIGVQAGGHLVVEAGGDVDTQGTTIIGQSNSVDTELSTLTVTNSGSSLNTTAELLVGRNRDANMTISDGASATAGWTTVGDAAGVDGQMTVTGSASQFNTGNLTVGNNGDATLQIEAGANVNALGTVSMGSAAGTGWATVTGSATSLRTWDIIAGNEGEGHVTISAGAVSGVNTVKVAALDGSTGSLTVIGTDSLLESFNPGAGSVLWIEVGKGGAGTLNVAAGGQVKVTDAYVGGNGSATVTITGSGSALYAEDELVVGDTGEADLSVETGAVVTCATAVIGQWIGAVDPTLDSTVTIDGSGSALSSTGNLTIGYYRDGVLTISDGGSVTTAGNAVMGFANIGNVPATPIVGNASVAGIGSLWDIDGNLTVGADGLSTLTIDDGGLVQVDGTVAVDTGAVGDASSIDMYYHGSLSIFGDTSASLTAFLAQIGGTGLIQFDNGSGLAHINTASTADYSLIYADGYTTLTIHLLGDANLDGQVDVADLGILATYYQTGGSHGWEHGDFTGDGFVDVNDLGILATYYGSTSASAVPEPTAYSLLLTGLIGLLITDAMRRRMK